MINPSQLSDQECTEEINEKLKHQEKKQRKETTKRDKIISYSWWQLSNKKLYATQN